MKIRAFHGMRYPSPRRSNRPGFAAGVVLPPMPPRRFADAIANGDVLPPKATRFLPKLVSGLVWAAHADPIA